MGGSAGIEEDLCEYLQGTKSSDLPLRIFISQKSGGFLIVNPY